MALLCLRPLINVPVSILCVGVHVFAPGGEIRDVSLGFAGLKITAGFAELGPVGT